MSNTDSQRLDAMRRQRDGYRNQLRKTDIDRLRTQVDASILHAALVAIQKLHKPCKTFSGKEVCNVCNTETGRPVTYPCKTRKLADEGLDRMAQTNQGGNDD